MAEFAETLQRAEGLLAERPLRTTLTEAEISRIAEFHYAEMLAADDEFVIEGAADEEAFTASIAKQLTEADVEFGMGAPWGPQFPTASLTDNSPREPSTSMTGDQPQEPHWPAETLASLAS